MEIAAFASFGALILAWIVLPVRNGASAATEQAAGLIADPVAA